MRPLNCLLLLFLACSCTFHAPSSTGRGVEYARWFSLTDSSVIVHSPYGGTNDTLLTSRPRTRLVCMSTSYAGYLESFGAGAAVVGISGRNFLSDSLVRAGAREVGYEAQPDYEGILSLRPDLVLTYTVSSAEPPYLQKLRSLGIRVLVLYDQLEDHPLARAEYIRLFGALTGRRADADSPLPDA